MASMTLAQAMQKLGVMLDMDVQTGDFPRHVTDWLNEGGLRVWEARPWFGRVQETSIFTVAPYSTGTATFTQGSATVTGSGTAWTSAMIGRKTTIGLGSPWYRITAVASVTSMTVSDVYAETTATASRYTIFQDEYDVPTNGETIVGLWLYNPFRGGYLKQITEQSMNDVRFVNAAIGLPYDWSSTISQTSNVRRIRVNPIPDAIYRFRLDSLKQYTQLVSPGDVSELSDNRQRAWILAACLEAQRGGDARQVTSDAEVEAAITLAFSKEQATSPLVVRRLPVGSGTIRGTFFLNDDRAP